MFERLRRLGFLDRALKNIETYTSLTEQYPWIKWPFSIGTSLLLSVWTMVADSWIPLGITVGLATFVSLSFLPAAVRSLDKTATTPRTRQPPAPPAAAASSSVANEHSDRIRSLELALSNVIWIEGMRISKEILSRWIQEAPYIPKMDERKELDIDLLRRELSAFEGFSGNVERELTQMVFRSDFRNIIQNVEGMADIQIREMGKSPNDLPPYEFREWFIARSKAHRILDYIKRKRSELDDEMISDLSTLEEQKRNIETRDRRD